MERQYQYNGHTYWIKVEPVINEGGEHRGYMAWVSNEKPGALLYGKVVRNENGMPIVFADELTAFITTNAIMEGELNRL